MTSGRLIAMAIIGITALFAAVLWYAQTRAYFTTLDRADLVVALPSGDRAALAHDAFVGIDAASSPLRFRGCFMLGATGLAQVAEAMPYPDPTPLIAPDWFDCYDAGVIVSGLADGTARAVLSEHDIHRGVDRVIAVFPDGRGYAWHQLNGTLE
ncbi:histidine kinase [Rhodobacterales bacterium LSUCC0031]|nr:histidine kinase [Rhodobacterales bacterium LSUCC0031]